MDQRDLDNGRASSVAILIDTPTGDGWVIDQGGVDSNGKRIGDYMRVKDKVSPREFKGLLLIDDRIRRNKAFLTPEESKKIAVEEARRIADEQFSSHSPLPIYGTSGDLLWPKQIPHSELSQQVSTKAA